MRFIQLPEDQLREMYGSHKSSVVIAREYGVSVNTVLRRMRSAGIPVIQGACGPNKGIALHGRIFGNLRVVNRGRKWWECECQCGKLCLVPAYNLLSGQAKSCGCQNQPWRFRKVTHGKRYLPEYAMWQASIQRARKAGLPHDITLDDIVIPEMCPVLGIVLETSHHRGWPLDSSPTLDRIVPKTGYVKGNVWVISWRANRIKGGATLDELSRLVAAISSRVCKKVEVA